MFTFDSAYLENGSATIANFLGVRWTSEWQIDEWALIDSALKEYESFGILLESKDERC